MNLGLIFLTGLTTGGLSCLAVQGGLLAGAIANGKKTERPNKTFDYLDWLPVAIFLLAKLVSYTVLGWLLGSLGSVMSLSLEVRVIFQVLTAIFMLATAANLLEIHPIFRYLTFQPPKFLQKLIRSSSKSQAIFGPGILGIMTVFIPCGITQAMEVLAISSAKPLSGALIMFSFVLGTMPLFSLIGIATARLSEVWRKKFTVVTAVVLAVMAIYTLNAALIIVGSPLAIKSSIKSTQLAETTITNGVQLVTINIGSRGYSPNFVQVKVNIPVSLTLASNNARSCAVAFVFNEFGIRTVLGANDKQVFNFTPTKKGKFAFSCSMGMYRGIMEVI